MKPSKITTTAILFLFNSIVSLHAQSFPKKVVLIHNEPDSLRRFTFDIGGDFQGGMATGASGIEATVFFRNYKKLAFQLGGTYYFNSIKYPADFLQSHDTKAYYQVEAIFSLLPWRKEKIKSSTVITSAYNPAGVSTENIDTKRVTRYGFRFGYSLSRLPIKADNAPRLGLKYIRNEQGNIVEYTGTYATTGTSSLITFGLQRRKQLRYRCNIYKPPGKLHSIDNVAKIRDMYFDLTYLTAVSYLDMSQITHSGQKHAYSIHPADNPIRPLGWRAGMQFLNESISYLGFKFGVEVGCRYGINASSFTMFDTSAYYSKVTLGLTFLNDPIKIRR
ncbi:MAG: hypothetical protein GC180_12850 [Bacteroidetes bacterium]|nr:hypothetical protein [Bacteroidota bacterium]